MRGGSQQKSQQNQKSDEVQDGYEYEEDLIEIRDEGGDDDDDEHFGPPASQISQGSSYWDGSQASSSQASRYDDDEDDEIDVEADEERHGSVGPDEEDDDEEDERGGGRRAFSRAVEDLESRPASQEPEQIPSSDDQQNEDGPIASQNEVSIQSSFVFV